MRFSARSRNEVLGAILAHLTLCRSLAGDLDDDYLPYFLDMAFEQAAHSRFHKVTVNDTESVSND